MNNSPSPPPTLSSTLLTQFNTFSGGAGVRIFRTMYLHLWRWLWPISRIESVTLGYNVPVILGQVTPSLPLSQWFLLCKLYTLSRGGVDAVNSHHYQFTSRERHNVPRLMDHGFVVRTSFDPAHPHAVRPSSIQKTYISLTPSGIAYHKLVVKEIHRLSHLDTYRMAVSHQTKDPDS